jgi:hypothetical protein
MKAQDIEHNLTEAKVSKNAGYILMGEQKTLDVCPFSGANLSENESIEIHHDLIEMTESTARPRDHISCEEEERSSQGFDTRTYFSIPGGDFGRVERAALKTGEDSLLNFSYIPAARLTYINKKWRSRKDEGFPLGFSYWNLDSRKPATR